LPSKLGKNRHRRSIELTLRLSPLRWDPFEKDHSTRAPFMNERIARLRTHQKNIERYQSLLKTKLNDVEVQFLEKRLSEERLAMLQFMGPSGAAKGDHPDAR
jgi:hypothetical protein